MTKCCTNCNQNLPLSAFHKKRDAKYGVMPICGNCRNPKVVSKKYGLTVQQLLDLFIKQNNKCAICKSPKSDFLKGLAVDHCHKTGKVRGLLCPKCNTGIGQLKDSIKILKAAIKYLEDSTS